MVSRVCKSHAHPRSQVGGEALLLAFIHNEHKSHEEMREAPRHGGTSAHYPLPPFPESHRRSGVFTLPLLFNTNAPHQLLAITPPPLP